MPRCKERFPFRPNDPHPRLREVRLDDWKNCKGQGEDKASAAFWQNLDPWITLEADEGAPFPREAVGGLLGGTRLRAEEGRPEICRPPMEVAWEAAFGM